MHWNRIKRNAHKHNHIFDITIQYAWELFLKQNRQCALSGLELDFPTNYKDRYECCTASLDRIDSDVGYIEGNVQWVHKHINMMKQSFDQFAFITMCEAIANYNR